MKYWIFLMVAIISEVIATTNLKLAEGFTKPVYSTAVIVGYVASFYFLSLTLKSIPLGIAYAIWAGIGIVLVSLSGLVIFNQKLDLWGILGMTLIVSGVLVINLLSDTHSQ